MVSICAYKLVIHEDVFFDAKEEVSVVMDNRDILGAHSNVNDPTDEQAPSTNETRLSSKRSLDNTGEPLPSDQPQPVAKKTKAIAPKKESYDENSKPARSTTTECGQAVAKRKFNNITSDDENTSKTTTPAAPKSKPSSKRIKVLNSKQTLGDISNKSLPSASVEPKQKAVNDKQQPQIAVDKPAADSKVVKKSNTPPVPPSATIVNNNKIRKRLRIPRSISVFRARMRLKLPRISEVKAFCGFENENTVCHAEGQLYTLNKGLRWKKRGVGALLLDKDENESRLVLLNEIDFRLILNLKLFFGMKAFIMDEQYVRFDAFDTVKDVYGRSEVKLVNYAIKVDDADTAQEICKQINSCIPCTLSPVPKSAIADAINKDVTAVISQLMPKKQWKLQ